MNATRSPETDPHQAAPPLVAACLNALHETTPITWLWRGSATPPIDGHLDLTVAGVRVRLDAVVRSNPDELLLEHLGLLQQQRGGANPLVLCARRVPKKLATGLLRLGIHYVDSRGSASLTARGIVVRVKGTGRASSIPGSTRLTGNDLRLLHVLLRDGGTDGRSHRQLAASAGIALGAIGAGLRRLEVRGLLRRHGKVDWRVVERESAQAQFAEGWLTLLRAKSGARRYRAVEPEWVDRLPSRLAAAEPRCLLGGEMAAARYTGAIHSDQVTIHVPTGQLREAATELGLFPDSAGPVVLLERFGTGDDIPDADIAGLRLAHPLLIHAECRAAGDERAAIAADEVWSRWLTEGTRDG